MRPPTRYALLVGLFLAAYSTTAACIRAINPWSDADGLRTKIDVFHSQRDEFDALYLGSSHVYHALRPEVIDPIVADAASGLDSFRSFNLGMEGMFSFETDTLLREVLTDTPERLRWVIVEAPTWRPKLSKADIDVVTERNARWHDPFSTFFALQSLVIADRSAQETSEFASASVHLQLLGLWLGNHGRGPEIWNRFTANPGEAERRLADEYRAHRGYRALERGEGELFELRQRNFLAKANEFPERVARFARSLEKRRDQALPMDNYNHAALARQVRAVRAAGLDVVYVTLPALAVPRYFDQLSREGRLPNYFDLRDPARYPELWTVVNRFDDGHLSEDGAALLSRIFAERFARLAREEAR